MARRLKSYHDRIANLLDCMVVDTISTKENIDSLKLKIYEYTMDVKFKRCKSMGQIIKNALAYVLRNYENVNPANLK
jgi:hypothetical protein